MNIASLLVLLIVAAAIWLAIRQLRRHDGHPCSGCRGGGCPHCHEHQ